MDKISSGLLEANVWAESYWARAPSHRRSPVIGANSNSNGPKLLGPFAHSLGKPNVSGAIPYVGRPYGPILAVLEQFQNAPIFE